MIHILYLTFWTQAFPFASIFHSWNVISSSFSVFLFNSHICFIIHFQRNTNALLYVILENLSSLQDILWQSTWTGSSVERPMLLSDLIWTFFGFQPPRSLQGVEWYTNHISTFGFNSRLRVLLQVISFSLPSIHPSIYHPTLFSGDFGKNLQCRKKSERQCVGCWEWCSAFEKLFSLSLLCGLTFARTEPPSNDFISELKSSRTGWGPCSLTINHSK